MQFTENRKHILRPHNSWLAVISLALGSFAAVTTEFLPVGVLPEIARAFNVTAGQAGLMMTFPGLLAAFAGPGVLLLAGRTDRKFLLIGLSILLVISALLCAWAPVWQVMLAGRALAGLSLGAFWALGLAVAGRLVTPEKASSAVAAVFAGVTAAMILGVPLGNFVADIFSWRIAFLAAALIATVPLIMQFCFLPPVPAEDKLRLSSVSQFFQSSPARKSISLTALIFCAHFSTYTFLASLLSEAEVSSRQITLLLLGFGLTGFLSNFVASYLVNRSFLATLVMSIVMMLVSLLLLASVTNPILASVGVLVWGAAWGALPLCLNYGNRHAANKQIEAGSAVFTFIAQIAIAAGATVGGIIVDASNTRYDFMTGAILIIISLVLIYVWRNDSTLMHQASERKKV